MICGIALQTMSEEIKNIWSNTSSKIILSNTISSNAGGKHIPKFFGMMEKCCLDTFHEPELYPTQNSSCNTNTSRDHRIELLHICAIEDVIPQGINYIVQHDILLVHFTKWISWYLHKKGPFLNPILLQTRSSILEICSPFAPEAFIYSCIICFNFCASSIILSYGRIVSSSNY